MNTRRWAAAFLALAAASAGAQTPVGTAFTYQGRLTDNGQPANGAYDFLVHLYDAATGGTIQNPLAGISLNDVPVTNGLFTVPIDFGAYAFAGDARWMSIQVRPGPSIGIYTPLSPRQPLTPAPYATFASASAQWKTAGAGITNTNPDDFVGINRSDRVTGVEFFGIQAPVQSGFGGMYLRTDGTTAKPFYGYRAGTGAAAWTYLDGASGDWRISTNGADRVTVTDTGSVGIGTIAPTGKLHIVSPSQTAGLFENTDAASFYPAVSGLTAAPGTAIAGRNNGSGRAGSFLINNASNSSPALEGLTDGSGPAILAKKLTNTSAPALAAEAAAPTATALSIVKGGIRCQGAGDNTNTFVFRHISPGNGWEYSDIDNPQTNGQPDLFLFVTPWYTNLEPGIGRSHPYVAAFYNIQSNKWALVAINGGFSETLKWNIMVVKP